MSSTIRVGTRVSFQIGDDTGETVVVEVEKLDLGDRKYGTPIASFEWTPGSGQNVHIVAGADVFLYERQITGVIADCVE